MLWTRNYNWDGADASYPIGAPPVVGMYNPEVTAAEIERHFTGVATMPADQLMKSAGARGGSAYACRAWFRVWCLAAIARSSSLGTPRQIRLLRSRAWSSPNTPCCHLSSTGAKLLGTTIRNSDNITNTPVGSSAAAVWRGFNSSLARRALEHAATWDCAAGVNSSVPLNWIAVGQGGDGWPQGNPCPPGRPAYNSQ